MKNVKKNNKGFSLVELIVVIAIMAVLGVAVALAVTKFIPQAARSTDISNATMIAEACEVAVNDFATSPDTKTVASKTVKAINNVGETEVFTGTGDTKTVALDKLVETGLLKSNPDIQGSATDLTVNSNKKFTVTYNSKTGKVTAVIGTYGSASSAVDLLKGNIPANYKNDSLSSASFGDE